MSVGFQQRERCPLCDSSNNRLLCDIPYNDQRLANYIEQFYRGRVALQSLQAASYRVALLMEELIRTEGIRIVYAAKITHI